MSSNEGSAKRWRRFTAEVLTIVLGILLALAADEGRQALANRATERDALASMRSEFAADVRELKADQADRQQKLANIDLLIRIRTGAAERPPATEMAKAWLDLLGWRYYTASHPVLDDLASTGRLDLIRSNKLRAALMRFGQERSRVGVVEQYERDFIANQVAPYLAARVDLEALSSDSPERVAAAVASADGMLGDAQFGSLLYLSRDRTESSHRFGERLLASVAAVQGQLGPQD